MVLIKKFLTTWQVLLLTPLIIISACSDNDNPPVTPNAEFQVTVSNITHGQPLTPVAVILHSPSYSPWQVGTSASIGLEELAESGDASAFTMAADADMEVYASTASSAGPFGPGSNQTVSLTTASKADFHISVTSMLANTNDAFTGVGGIDVSQLAVGESSNMLAHAYDAGTEANSESAGTIPGPADGGEGFNASRMGDTDFISIHAGVLTADDGLPSSVLTEAHRWQGPVAMITVTRMQ